MKPDSSLPPLMIVEDDEDDMLLLARRLQSAGVKNTLLHFPNGGEAFMFLKHFCPPEKTADPLPCLMFLDVNMPGLSGFDILAWTRQQPALAAIKIFVLSGASEEWDAKIAAKLGADEYLTKFPEPAVLSDLLSNICPLAAH
ncbi:MAG: response regulator [Opitutaceae bacterium]